MAHKNLQVRVQAIRGLPLFCKDTPEHLSKIIDILAQLLTAGRFSVSGYAVDDMYCSMYTSNSSFVDTCRRKCGA